MLVIVLISHMILALLCLKIAWKVWRWRCAFRRAADTLTAVERRTHQLLLGAPDMIAQGEQGVQQFHQRMSQLDLQLMRAHQTLRLLGWGHGAWRRRGRNLIAVRRFR